MKDNSRLCFSNSGFIIVVDDNAIIRYSLYRDTNISSLDVSQYFHFLSKYVVCRYPEFGVSGT